MLRHLLFALSLNTFAWTAQAQAPYEDADCAFFEDAGHQGAYWTATVDGKDPSSPTLTDWWQDRASSVWVKPGYVFEAYTDVGFKGRRVDITSMLPTAVPAGAGFTVNLTDLTFNDQMSSYRCRPAGEEKVLARGSVLWLEGAQYSWLSGGNHPNHRTVQMKTEGTDLIVLVHSDNTYGINRQDYRVNLSSSQVHVDFVGQGMAKGQADFDLLLAAMRPDFKVTLQELIQDISTVAQGYAAYPPTVEPPKPELQSLIHYLQAYAG